MSRVTFIDTSVLCELLQVPGKSQQAAAVRTELEQRVARGEQFVIPVTAVIETGNHIVQANGDRYGAAQRLCRLIAAAVGDDRSFRLHEFRWDGPFLQAVCAGDSTPRTFEQWAAARELGTGDLAVLVERDRFVADSAFSRTDVEIWTLDEALGQNA